MSMYKTPIEQIIDGNGKPIVGAKKFLFSVGTEVKKTVFSDPELTLARANPVLSNADGRFPQFYLDGLYDEIQQDNSGTATGYDGATLWGPEQVGEIAEGPLLIWATDTTYNIPDIALGSDDEYYKTLIDSNQGNDPVSSPGSWEQLQFGRIWNVNVTYAKGDAVYASDGYSYISIVASNVGNNPISSPTQWRPNANVMQSAIAAGTADAITAVFPIPFTALNDQTIVSVRALLANATTTPTFAPDGLTAKTIVKNGSQTLVAGDIFGASHELILKYNSTNDVWELLNSAEAESVGKTLQTVTATTSATTSGTTVLPYDSTIPQSTEGDEYLTLAITPKSSTSKLIIDFNGFFHTNTGTLTIALFKDAETDAISASSSGAFGMMVLNHELTSGGTSPITFKIRAGSGSASTTTNNGIAGNPILGGTIFTTLKITEVKA